MNDLLKNGRRLVSSLKVAAGSAPDAALVIPVGSPPVAFLRPIATCAARLRQEDVIDLTDWRNRFVTSFLTEFIATPERTASWLINIVGPNESKILFMIDMPNGNPIGHIGLDFIDWTNGYGEADAIVRGRDAPQGLMRKSLLAAIAWAKAQLGLTSIGVRVMSNNPALHFYSKVGFVEIKRVPLRRITEPNLTRLVEDANANDGVCLVHMLMN